MRLISTDRLRTLAAGLLGLALAGPAGAAPLGFTATLVLEFATLSPLVVTGGGVASVSGPTTFTLAAGAIATSGLPLDVSDPASFPIEGVLLTVANGSGSFAAGGGTMPLLGAVKVCLFEDCPAATANLAIPLDVIGQGGLATSMGAVNISVFGSPWTTGTASIGSFTHVGSVAGGGAVAGGSIRYVTPVYFSTDIGVGVTIPFWATLELAFVPEPGTLVLLGMGVAALAGLGRQRCAAPRRKGAIR